MKVLVPQELFITQQQIKEKVVKKAKVHWGVLGKCGDGRAPVAAYVRDTTPRRCLQGRRQYLYIRSSRVSPFFPSFLQLPYHPSLLRPPSRAVWEAGGQSVAPPNSNTGGSKEKCVTVIYL
ncbi:hypothetical protein E2C01_088403 [Portunus trituberculatus]|uniref:Uncharacterized protein n=1 Tax=Portunus trituberculatus TaxID=210409 RepID=A0A5B7JEE0_PORTR|nr:hypothetical protein [Portunus trituberculatus]